MKKNTKQFFGLFIVLAAGLLISACSSGSSGGSVTGTGTSSVEGNVSSANFAMLRPAVNTGSSLADFFNSLVPTKPAYAATTVEGIQVEIAQMRTVTDANGYFRFDGVPPGTHEVRFSRNGYNSSMSVNVGVDDMVTMQDINMNGPRAHARSVSHMNTNEMPGSPGMQGTPGTSGTPRN